MELKDMSKEELLKLVEELQNASKKKDEIIEQREATIAKLEAEKRELNLQLEALIAKYEARMQANRKLLADRFMPKSEKLDNKTDDDSPDEGNVINEVEQLAKETKPRKTPSERFIEELKSLQEKVIVYDYDFEANGINRENVKEFGVDESFKIEMKPVAFEVVKIERPKYKDKNHIYQSVSDDPFPHSVLTPSLAANIIEMKYILGIPLFRYAQYMNSHGIGVSPQDLSNYVMRTMKLLDPLYVELEKALVNTKFKVIHGDETPLKVLDSKKQKCYMFAYSTSFWDNAVYIYKFSETRKIDNTIELLKDFEGYYICDGYSAYDALPNKVNNKIKIQRCWSHQRRFHYDCIKSLSKINAPKSPAYGVVEAIDEMFKLERMMRENKYTKEQIEAFRNGEEYQKVIAEIDSKILSTDCGSNSYLTKAVKHYKNDKNELYTFLENGYIDISNNLCERIIRPFTVARKNFLFCKTEDGAEVTGKLFSIMQTARANGLISELYLQYVIENIKKVDINDLLPWSMKLPEELKISSKLKD